MLIKGFAGLCNRMLVAATGIVYAEVCDRRPIVDWRDRGYADDGSEVFGKLFDSPAVGRVDELPGAASILPEVWEGRLHEAVGNHVPRGVHMPQRMLTHTLSVDLTRTEYPAEVVVMSATRDRIDLLRPHFHGRHARWARVPTAEILREVLQERMRPREEIRAAVDGFRRERLQGPSVGVHVRASDLRTRVEAIARRLRSLLVEKPGLTVFLATDSRDVKQEFERRYGAVTTQHRYATGDLPLHRAPPGDRDGLAREALVDLHLLAACEHLIGDATSSFSRVAMILSRAPSNRIHDMQPLRGRWHMPPKTVWRLAVPGPASPVAVAVARRLLV